MDDALRSRFARALRNIAPALAMLATAPVAAVEHEGGSWLTTAVSARPAKNWSTSLAVQARFDDDFSRLERSVIRPSVTYASGPRWAFTLGYDAHLREEPEDLLEQRVWQQVTWRSAGERVSSALRLRLEETFIEDAGDVLVRARLRYQIRLPAWQSGWSFIASEELFFVADDARVGPQDGFDQARTYLGFGRPLADDVRFEVGYQNQYLDRPAGDRMLHQLMLAVTWNLD